MPFGYGAPKVGELVRWLTYNEPGVFTDLAEHHSTTQQIDINDAINQLMDGEVGDSVVMPFLKANHPTVLQSYRILRSR